MTPVAEPIANTLLANRELLSLGRARIYLGSRARTRTPLGAIECLAVMGAPEGENYDKRVRLALDCIEIYRELFPEEYARSSAPHFSTQREHEFYRLVHTRLFPLLFNQEVDTLTLLEREPLFFLPFIPLRGIQRHIWGGGQFHFWEIETVFRLAQVLSFGTGAGGRGWEALRLAYGLDDELKPAPPLAAVGWSLFRYSCAVEESPLRFLPYAFELITYKTGNPWLDLPQIGFVGFEWSSKEIMRLALQWREANSIVLGVETLDQWLAGDPKQRLSRAIELWNDAAVKEREAGAVGLLIDHETGEWYG